MSADRRRPDEAQDPDDPRAPDDAPAPDDPPAPDDRPGAWDPLRPVVEQLGLTPPSEVARAGLNRAAAAARAKGIRPGRPGAARPTSAAERAERAAQRSGPGADGRDPALVGDTLARLAAERGWSTDLSVGGVIGRWREVVGDQIADHCAPETFEDGTLVVRTDSTTWATNLRLLAPELLGRLATELGPGVVREVRVLGPAGPGWVRGQRRVPGRGPRDTYG